MFNPPNRYAATEMIAPQVSSPFCLIDVGCSGGIDDRWRRFEPRLIAHAFDPQQGECDALNRAEANANVAYHAYFVGVEDEAQRARFAAAAMSRDDYFDIFHRSSSSAFRAGAPLEQRASNEIDLPTTDQWISVDRFVAEQSLERVDFMKVDTDGGDLEVLFSAASTLASKDVLGVLVESQFLGPPGEYSNTLANIDTLMRAQGYQLQSLDVNRYSRPALPAPLCYDILAQTHVGQATWGDALYMRDINHPGYRDYRAEVTSDEILKTACIYELFGLPDCAAETILTYAHAFAALDMPRLLSGLTAQMTGGRYHDYDRYVRDCQADPMRLSRGRREAWVFKVPVLRTAARLTRDWLTGL